jgi:tetratricopeptide (TPR) repeat protein
LPELDGRVALQEGRPIADAELMAREPVDGDEAELGPRWSSALRRGQALARRGLADAAIDAYGEAEVLLDRMVQTVGVDQGRELLLAGKQRSARALVDLLVDRGRPEEALCAARLARLRGLRALDRAARLTALGPDVRARWDQAIADYQRNRQRAAELQRDAWRHVGAGAEHNRRLQQDAAESAARALDRAYAALGDHATPRCLDLPPPAPGELVLFIFAGETDWIAFAADTTGVAAARLPAPQSRDLAATSRALLDPFADRLAAAARLRVLTSGIPWDIPVHALPWQGDIVLSAWPVSYALDLPGPRAPTAAGHEALVIADPTGNLAHARDEARSVAATLGAQGWHVARLEQREATGAAVLAALAGADLLHYAGHGSRDGLSGWGSVLALADDDTLAIHDVLALSRVPQTVVLSGCETAASDAAALAGGMNLARAFLIAGATAVIAADEVIDDALAAELSTRLHDGLAPGAVVDAPARLRHALLELRRARPGSQEWAKFRALVP